MLLESPNKWFLHFYVSLILEWLEKWYRKSLSKWDMRYGFSSLYRKNGGKKAILPCFPTAVRSQKELAKMHITTLFISSVWGLILEEGDLVDFSLAHCISALRALPPSLCMQIDGGAWLQQENMWSENRLRPRSPGLTCRKLLKLSMLHLSFFCEVRVKILKVFWQLTELILKNGSEWWRI